MSNFRKKYSLKARKLESLRILGKNPSRIPIIIEPHSKELAAKFTKIKYLVPGELTVGQFINVIRNRIKLNPAEALFIMFNNTCPSNNQLLSNIYKTHKSEDLFLYAHITKENTFGYSK